jgi:hypothetical protein
MAAGAALLQLSVVLLCHAQQDINIQLDNNGNAGYKYDKFGTAVRKTCCQKERIFCENLQLSNVLLCFAQQLQLFCTSCWIFKSI